MISASQIGYLLTPVKRAFKIPHGLPKVYIGTRRNYSTKDSSSNGINENRTSDDSEENIFTTSPANVKVFKDLIQRIISEKDSSKRSELLDGFWDKAEKLVKTLNFQYKKLHQERIKCFQLVDKLDMVINEISFVKCCSAIEAFELKYGGSAVIDDESIPEDLPLIERDTRVRALHYEWIFANRSEEHGVKTLLKLVNDSKVFDNVADFCKCIAVAHKDLSKTIQASMLTPTNLKYTKYACLTTPKASKALSILMSIYKNNDVI